MSNYPATLVFDVKPNDPKWTDAWEEIDFNDREELREALLDMKKEGGANPFVINAHDVEITLATALRWK